MKHIPGSKEALENGCICSNKNGNLIIEDDCPEHWPFATNSYLKTLIRMTEENDKRRYIYTNVYLILLTIFCAIFIILK